MKLSKKLKNEMYEKDLYTEIKFNYTVGGKPKIGYAMFRNNELYLDFKIFENWKSILMASLVDGEMCVNCGKRRFFNCDWLKNEVKTDKEWVIKVQEDLIKRFRETVEV